MVRTIHGGLVCGITTAVLGCGVAVAVAAAAPPPAVPGPADPGYCGAHTSPWDCWSDVSPARPGEIAFINDRLQYDMAGIPTDQTRLLQIARGICQSVAGGTRSNSIVQWLAEDIGVSENQAGQLFIMVNDRACG